MFITLIKIELVRAQTHVMNNPSNYLGWPQVERLRNQLETYLMEQEIHWVQRTRQTWLQLGDGNNRYFQTMAIIRKHQNAI